jgi:hypothetical protein
MARSYRKPHPVLVGLALSCATIAARSLFARILDAADEIACTLRQATVFGAEMILVMDLPSLACDHHQAVGKLMTTAVCRATLVVTYNCLGGAAAA